MTEDDNNVEVTNPEQPWFVLFKTYNTAPNKNRTLFKDESMNLTVVLYQGKAPRLKGYVDYPNRLLGESVASSSDEDEGFSTKKEAMDHVTDMLLLNPNASHSQVGYAVLVYPAKA